MSIISKRSNTSVGQSWKLSELRRIWRYIIKSLAAISPQYWQSERRAGHGIWLSKDKISTVLRYFCAITPNHDDLQTGLSVSIIPHYCFSSLCFYNRNINFNCGWLEGTGYLSYEGFERSENRAVIVYKLIIGHPQEGQIEGLE